MIIGFVRSLGNASVCFPGNTLTTYHDRWLTFLNSWPVTSFD